MSNELNRAASKSSHGNSNDRLTRQMAHSRSINGPATPDGTDAAATVQSPDEVISSQTDGVRRAEARVAGAGAIGGSAAAAAASSSSAAASNSVAQPAAPSSLNSGASLQRSSSPAPNRRNGRNAFSLPPAPLDSRVALTIQSPPSEIEWSSDSSAASANPPVSASSRPSSMAFPPSPSSPMSSPSPIVPLPAAPLGPSAAAAAQRRKAQVAQLIRAGESNPMFREKAPSIVPNETGLFLAPPSLRAQAAAAAAARAAAVNDGWGPLSGSDSKALSIPLLAAAAGATPLSISSAAHSPTTSSGASSPLMRPSTSAPRNYSSSPSMGISSRQLLHQMSMGASGGSTAAPIPRDRDRSRRSSMGGAGGGSGAIGAGAYSPPKFFRTRSLSSSADDGTGSGRSSGHASPALRGMAGPGADSDSESGSSRRFSFRGAPPSPSARGSPTLRGIRGRNLALMGGGGGGILGFGLDATTAAGTAGVGGGAAAADEYRATEEARLRAEQREAHLLAPFLEARGEEDFVTYDLTRQQDYHMRRKELTKQTFERQARARRRRGGAKERDEVDEASVLQTRAHREKEDEVTKQSRRRGYGGGGGGGDGHPPSKGDHDPSSSSSDPDSDDYSDVDDDEIDDEEWSRMSWSSRFVFWLWDNSFTRFFIRMFVMGQGWLLCGLVGVFTGLLASCVDLTVQWLIDLKSGYCNEAFYLSNSFCCAGSRPSIQQNFGGAQPLLLMCSAWTNWDQNSSIAPTLSQFFSPFLAGYLLYVSLGVGMACVSAWLVLFYAPHAAGSGIPEVKTILGGVVVKKYLGAWTLLIKVMAICLSVGAGLSVGKEGPFVHVACAIANILCRFFPEFRNNQYKKNEAITAATAAGISVAFGAPVGGVLFALEEVSSFFPHKVMWRAFFCAMISSVVLQSIDPYQAGKLVLFQITYQKTWYWFELFPFAMIGVLGGLFGAAFIALNARAAMFRQSSVVRQHPILEVFVVSLVTVLIKYLSGYMRGNNTAVLAALFGDCQAAPFYDPLSMCDENGLGETISALILTALCTFFFTCFTWSLCVPGGVFVPSMIIGACYGRVIGTLMRQWQASYSPALFAGCDEFTPGIYALVGAVSMLGGVTRMTVCLVVISFEITGNNGVSYILPVMVGLVFSKVVGDACSRRAIFETHLQLNNYPFLSAKDMVPPKVLVSDAMSRDLLALPMHGHSIASLKDQLALLAELRITGFPIVTTLSERFIVGYINRSELYTALVLALKAPLNTPDTRCYFAMLSLRFPRNDPYVDLRPWLHPSPIQVVEHTPLYRVHEIFRKLGLRYVLVTNFGRLTGILTKKDIQKTIQKHEKTLKKGDTVSTPYVPLLH